MSFVDLPEEFVQPDYEGGSIANIPATIAALLGAPFEGLPPLREPLWQPLGDEIRRVVLVVVDAMGWNLFQKERDHLTALLDRAAVADRITSVFPSTTVSALTSLWTGLAPAQHGLVGLRLFFPEYAVLAQMLKLSPNFVHHPDALIQAGLELEQFLHGPGFGEQLARAGIPSHAFKGWEIVDSVLSQMHGRGVTHNHGTVTPVEMFVQMRTLLESSPGAPMYLAAYWPSVDTLSHAYGWDGLAVGAELRSLMRGLEAELIAPLSREARRGTVLLVVADHGQVKLTPEQQIHLDAHPGLQERLLMRTAGEPRTAYLYARQGQVQAILDYMDQQLCAGIVAGTAVEALASGLLGPEPHAPGVLERLGDVVATMRDQYVLLNPDEKARANRLHGRHGGLTTAEMEVPWLAFRLDA